MKIKNLAASAVSICIMFSVVFAVSSSYKSLLISLEASAEYEFELIDETRASENVDAIEEYDYNEYDFEENAFQDNDDTYQGYSAYDVSTYENGTASYNPVTAFIVSLIIGLLVALAAVSVMKASMKSVRRKAGAMDYKMESNLKLERNQDIFLGKKVDKTPISRENPPQGTNINMKR